MKNLYFKSLKFLLLFLALSLSNLTFAALSPGDIAIIGFKGEPKGNNVYTSIEFTFIITRTIPANEPTITFTDHGWIAGAFNTNSVAEGYLKWTPTTQYVAGTIIKVTINSGGIFSSTNANFTGQSSVLSGWTNAAINSGGGDQVLVYQGTEASPTFIYGFTNTAAVSVHPIAGTWAASGVAQAATNSEIPPGLTADLHEVAHTKDAGVDADNTARSAANGWHADNLVFNGPFVSDRTVLLQNIANQANWIGHDGIPANIIITPGGGTIPTAITTPNIEITDALSIPILNGDAASAGNNTIFGSACVNGGTISKTYTIKNTGFGSLTFSGSPIAVVGGATTSFSVTTQPTSPIAIGASLTFTVLFDPAANGNQLATITLTNNDPAKSPFVINISGTGNASPNATITAANTVCQNSTLNLSVASAGGGATYLWSGHGVVLANSTSTTAVPKISGSLTYGVSITDANGCTATSTKSVTVNAQPAVTVNADQAICKGTSANLNATCLMNVSALLTPGANASTATGYAYGTYNTLTNQLDLTMVYNGLTSNITNAHIHAGAIGVNGPVIVPFAGWPANSTSGSFTYSGTGLPDANKAAFLAGNTYVNIHSVNFPGGEIRGQLSATACAANTYVWNPGAIAGQSVIVSPTATQMYELTASNSVTTCSASATTTVNVTPVTLPAVSATATQTVSNVPLVANGCEYLAKVVPTNFTGDATVKEWVESIPPFVYVPRHYEIIPVSAPASTSTATITLFYKQSDFNAYNGTSPSLLLPTGPGDVARIVNFQIVKYGGESSPNDGLPSHYTGSATLMPTAGNTWNGGGDYTFVWNSLNSYWEVTFPVTGFSGFFAKSVSQPLPVNLISFSGKKTGENQNTLKWITSNEKSFSHFEIQRSENAKAFENIGEVKGNSVENYQFVDNQANGINYYRLKMIDLDGKYNYSKTISIENSIEKSLVGNFYPNPTSGKVYVDVNATEKGNWNITTYDVVGKIVNTETKILQKGINKVALEKLNLGVNFVKFETEKISEIRKIIKN